MVDRRSTDNKRDADAAAVNKKGSSQTLNTAGRSRGDEKKEVNTSSSHHHDAKTVRNSDNNDLTPVSSSNNTNQHLDGEEEKGEEGDAPDADVTFFFDQRSVAASRFFLGVALLYEAFVEIDYTTVRTFLTNEGLFPSMLVAEYGDGRLPQLLHFSFGFGSYVGWAYFLHMCFIFAAVGILLDLNLTRAHVFSQCSHLQNGKKRETEEHVEEASESSRKNLGGQHSGTQRERKKEGKNHNNSRLALVPVTTTENENTEGVVVATAASSSVFYSFFFNVRWYCFVCWFYLMSVTGRNNHMLHSFDRQLLHLLMWGWLGGLYSTRVKRVADQQNKTDSSTVTEQSPRGIGRALAIRFMSFVKNVADEALERLDSDDAGDDDNDKKKKNTNENDSEREKEEETSDPRVLLVTVVALLRAVRRAIVTRMPTVPSATAMIATLTVCWITADILVMYISAALHKTDPGWQSGDAALYGIQATFISRPFGIALAQNDLTSFFCLDHQRPPPVKTDPSTSGATATAAISVITSATTSFESLIAPMRDVVEGHLCQALTFLDAHVDFRQCLVVSGQWTLAIEIYVPLLMAACLLIRATCSSTLSLSTNCCCYRRAFTTVLDVVAGLCVFILLGIHIGMAIVLRLNDITLINFAALQLFLPALFWETHPSATLTPRVLARLGNTLNACVIGPFYRFFFLPPDTTNTTATESISAAAAVASTRTSTSSSSSLAWRLFSTRIPLLLQVGIIVYRVWAFLLTLIVKPEGVLKLDYDVPPMPSWVQEMSMKLATDVNWGVFSPRPPSENWRVSIPAMLVTEKKEGGGDLQHDVEEEEKKLREGSFTPGSTLYEKQQKLLQQQPPVFVDLLPFLRQDVVRPLPNLTTSEFANFLELPPDTMKDRAFGEGTTPYSGWTRQDSNEHVFNSYTLRDNRWNKYFEWAIVPAWSTDEEMQARQAHRLALGRYICREWNRDKPDNITGGRADRRSSSSVTDSNKNSGGGDGNGGPPPVDVVPAVEQRLLQQFFIVLELTDITDVLPVGELPKPPHTVEVLWNHKCW